MEFTLPDDGVIVKASDGRPVIELSSHDEGNIVRLFSADGEARIAFGTHGDTAVFIVGNPETEGVTISVGPYASEVSIVGAGKSITTAISATHSELRFVNAENELTSKIYVDERGGQIGLSDHQGNLLVSAGAQEDGGTCHLMNSTGDTVVVVGSNEQNGNITLLDDAARIRIMVGHKSDANIHLINRDGRIVWTTMQE